MLESKNQGEQEETKKDLDPWQPLRIHEVIFNPERFGFRVETEFRPSDQGFQKFVNSGYKCFRIWRPPETTVYVDILCAGPGYVNLASLGDHGCASEVFASVWAAVKDGPFYLPKYLEKLFNLISVYQEGDLIDPPRDEAEPPILTPSF